MRIGIVTLATIIAAVILSGSLILTVYRAHQPAPLTVSVQASPAPAAAKAPAAAPSTSKTTFGNGVRRIGESYRSHRQTFATVSDYSERARQNWVVGLIGFAIFLFLTLPRNVGGARAFYNQMMEQAPLPPDSKVTDDDYRQARKVLFFYLLFLLYQIVQFPLTLGHDKGVPFYADLIIQTALLISVVWAYRDLKRGLRARLSSDPAQKEKLDDWLNEKLDGMNIRWRDISKLAVGVFIAGFTPAVLSHLVGWLDALTDFGVRMVG
ncbi:MAG: hypothetical protein WCA81_08130 [Rhizomicrobium sp.]